MSVTDKIRLAGVEPESVVDGDGIRMTVFVQGCSHHCKGCQNPGTWDYMGGYTSDVNKLFKTYKGDPLLQGITFSGGEPFEQPAPLSHLADMVHEAGGDVWAYTGYLLEELLKIPEKKRLLDKVDVLIDGPFVESLRDLTLRFRGSSNQRLLRKGEDGIFRVADK